MKPLLLCVVLGIASVCAQPPDGPPAQPISKAASLDPKALAAHLRELQADLDSKGASRVLAALPPAWEVATPERDYRISTEQLRPLLIASQIGLAQQDDNIRKAKDWLHQVAQQLESYSLSPTQPLPIARGRLDRILALREFAAVGPPSAWELFRERIALWIASLIQKFFSLAAQHPTEGRILFWIVVAGAVGLLATWLIRLWTRRDPVLRLPTPASPPPFGPGRPGFEPPENQPAKVIFVKPFAAPIGRRWLASRKAAYCPTI